MKTLRWLAAGSVAALLALPASGASTLSREFAYDPSAIRVVRDSDHAEIEMRGAMRDFTPGRPDLPLSAERVELPPGTRVSGIRVHTIETTTVAEGVRLATTVRPGPGLGSEERTAPDPAYFERPGFPDEPVVRIAMQGFERGRSIAHLEVRPLRWDPATGRLELVRRVQVELELEENPEHPLVRERIVRDWEDRSIDERTARGATPRIESLAGEPRQAEPFRPTQVPSLLGSPVAYVIITNDALAPQFQRLADWKTQAGVPAAVRTIAWIRQEYPFGADDAERIRMFIRDAYQRWGAQWVLLGGDTEVIPTRRAWVNFFGGEFIPCDMYYSCLDGNWNADGDAVYGEAFFNSMSPGDDVDLLPEVWVGRASVTTLQQAQTFVDKTFQYTRTPLGNYEHTALFFAEVLFPQDWHPGIVTSLDGAELAEEVRPYFDANPWWHVSRLYENHLDARWAPGPLLETRQAVIDSLDEGCNVAVHIGHGYRNVMSVGDDNMQNSHASALVNGLKLHNLYAINCTSNAIDFPCIGEAFMNNPNGGAVTNVGSTRFDFPTAGRNYQREYFRLMLEDSVTAVGELQARQKLPYIAFASIDGVNRWTQFTLLLLGDPELRVWTGTPRILSVTHPASVSMNDTSISVHVAHGGSPIADARVTVFKNNDEYRSVVTNPAGDATLDFRPDSLGAFTLTVTGFDCRPYQATLQVTASTAPVLSTNGITIDDDLASGTIGNGNGILDAGETVDLIVPVRNNGGGPAPSVSGTLSTTDPLVTIQIANASYGTLNPGTGASPVGGYRISTPFDAPDQREVPFTLRLFSGTGSSSLETFQLVVGGPDLEHNGHVVSEAGGNGNGVPEPGETVSYLVKLRNLGTGIGQGIYARLRNTDGLATVTDSAAAWADLPAGQEAQGDALTFVPSSTSARLELHVFDVYGELFAQDLDLVAPVTPTDLLGLGEQTSVKLQWTKNSAPDLLGYNVYRSLAIGGPFVKVNPVPTDRIAYYLDAGLSPLTPYYYRVTAMDSSRNESVQTPTASTSTTPPNHAIFPIPMGENTPSSVALDHLYTGYPLDIVAGSNKLFVWHHDGSYPIDADGSEVTSGDFSKRGLYFAAAPSIADLDGGGKEIIGPSWGNQPNPGFAGDSMAVYVFDLAGNVKPGWPLPLPWSIWSSAAIGDLDNDGTQELVFATNGPPFYVMRANGTEWMNGDNDPGTTGVFKVLTQPFNYGTPAIADIDMNGQRDIVFGDFSGQLFAWRPNGTDLPGFPLQLAGNITSSAAIGFLDGPGDPFPEIVIATSVESLYVINANGQRRAGFPVWMRTSANSRIPSPALADMNNDGFLDIVTAATNGGIWVWNRNGQLVPPWANIRYSQMTNGTSESSPIVADINGDGWNDVVMGDEAGRITALSGGTGAVLSGFPIQLEAEVKGTPGVCDCDGDGKTEIVFSGWDRNLYVWDYDFPFSPNGPPPWPQFHHDAARTGFFSNPVFVDVSDDVPGGPVTSVDFSTPWPNPATRSARATFAVPAEHDGDAYEIGVFDINGRLVRMLDRGVARMGRHAVEWNLRGADGDVVENGVYVLRFRLGGESASRKLVLMR